MYSTEGPKKAGDQIIHITITNAGTVCTIVNQESLSPVTPPVSTPPPRLPPFSDLELLVVSEYTIPPIPDWPADMKAHIWPTSDHCGRRTVRALSASVDGPALSAKAVTWPRESVSRRRLSSFESFRYASELGGPSRPRWTSLALTP